MEQPERRGKPAWRSACGVFAIVWLSCGWFWHSRDWNTASRLMLTYAIAERGTVRIDGLEDQTGDRARVGGHYYSDKLPGFSLAALGPYALGRAVFRWPDHPLGGPALAYWPADPWITWWTSGLFTAATAALLTLAAVRLGCGPRASALIGLAYGLATPAYVYGSLAYGHQATAFCTLAAFSLLMPQGGRLGPLRSSLIGFLTACAPVVELQAAPVSALLGILFLVRWPGWRGVAGYAVGAAIPLAALLAYNRAAFGSILDLGYFHHATEQFAAVHSRENPLGLRPPDWSKAIPLLWGQHRGLLFYAPILVLAPAGWIAFLMGRRWLELAGSLGACLAVFFVNLSYPEWSGGWSTGPRLLVPLIPFAMLGVAGAIAAWPRLATAVAAALALAGGILMLGFQSVGGRIPNEIGAPVAQVVWPLWRGADPPPWWVGERWTRTPLDFFSPGATERLDVLAFVIPAALQALAIISLMGALRSASPSQAKQPAGPNPGP